jgi:hypothetical protein
MLSKTVGEKPGWIEAGVMVASHMACQSPAEAGQNDKAIGSNPSLSPV